MLADLDEPDVAGSIQCDVCIIGSGAAGIAIAREFIGTSNSVVVLEGGGSAFETGSQEPYQSEVVGLPHSGIHHGRVRVLGGTTTLWPGQTIPLWDVDFRKRDWVPHSGWPIERETLQPYFVRAAEILGVGSASFDMAPLVEKGLAIANYQTDTVVGYYSKFSPTPNFSQAYRRQLSEASNIKLVTHANAVSLIPKEDATALREVVSRSFLGNQLRVSAKAFVVCCGGIETARLLLLSNSVERNGIGNRNDVVGRFFQDHPSIATPVRLIDAKRFSKWYDPFRSEGIKHHVKFAASETLQQKERILHVGAEIFYPLNFMFTGAKMLAGSMLQGFRRPNTTADTEPGAAPASAPSTDSSLVKLTGKRVRWYQSLTTVAQRLDQVGRTAFFRRHVLGTVARAASLRPHVLFGAEQEPNPNSRITLGNCLDSLGMRRAVLDWRLTDNEGKSILTFAKIVASEWRRLELAELNPDDLQIAGRQQGKHGGFMDFSHHMGTTRMGTDPATSVVDPSCRVHGYQNLYIGSCSVFTTSGFSNPTFTMLALCLRISDEIRNALK